MAFDHVIAWQIKNVISQYSQRLQPPNLVGTHMPIKWYHCYMSRDLLYVIYYIPLCHSYMSYYSCGHVIYQNFIAQLPRKL